MTGKAKEWLILRELFDASRYEGTLEGERQIFYVAVTRARDQVILSYYDKDQDFSALPSLFVEDEIGSDEITRLSDPGKVPLIKCSSPSKERKMLSFSAKDLLLFTQCPYRYRLNKEWGFLPGLSPDLGYGNALHFCLSEITVRLRNNYSVESAVDEVINTCLFLPNADKTRYEGLKKVARERLLSFAKQREADLQSVMGTKYRIEYPVRNGTITGKIDVMLEHPDGCEIMDYKTSDEVISPDDSAM